jgi:hypothetical protein
MANSEIILYSTPQGEIKIEVILQDETVWLTQRALGELFGVSKKTISEHLGNIYKSNELQREATVRKIRTVQNEGEREVASVPCLQRGTGCFAFTMPENQLIINQNNIFKPDRDYLWVATKQRKTSSVPPQVRLQNHTNQCYPHPMPDGIFYADFKHLPI